MHTARAASFLALACAAASASVVDRAQVTLGALSDAAHGVAQVTVRSVEPGRVQLRVDDALKGRLGPELWLPRGGARLAWTTGEVWLVFLAHDGAGWRPLSSEWHRVPQGGAELAAAVRSRLPRLEGTVGELQAALFAQLGSPQARVAADAAYDLLAFRALDPTAGELGELRLALERAPSPELFRLCAQIAHPALTGSVLSAARRVGARDVSLRAAAEALVALDGAAAMHALAGDLAGPEAGALRAVGLLSDMGEAARPHLQAGLSDPRAEVRAAAIRGLARGAAPLASAQANALLALARGGEPAERPLALAALARVGPAALLIAVTREHPDPALRELAQRLRRDPSELARRILGE